MQSASNRAPTRKQQADLDRELYNIGKSQAKRRRNRRRNSKRAKPATETIKPNFKLSDVGGSEPLTSVRWSQRRISAGDIDEVNDTLRQAVTMERGNDKDSMGTPHSSLVVELWMNRKRHSFWRENTDTHTMLRDAVRNMRFDVVHVLEGFSNPRDFILRDYECPATCGCCDCGCRLCAPDLEWEFEEVCELYCKSFIRIAAVARWSWRREEHEWAIALRVWESPRLRTYGDSFKCVSIGMLAIKHRHNRFALACHPSPPNLLNWVLQKNPQQLLDRACRGGSSELEWICEMLADSGNRVVIRTWPASILFRLCESILNISARRRNDADMGTRYNILRFVWNIYGDAEKDGNKSLLMMFVQRGNRDAVRYLVSNCGANVCQKTSTDGFNLLHLSVSLHMQHRGHGQHWMMVREFFNDVDHVEVSSSGLDVWGLIFKRYARGSFRGQEKESDAVRETAASRFAELVERKKLIIRKVLQTLQCHLIDDCADLILSMLFYY